jgi:hypothetical protein
VISANCYYDFTDEELLSINSPAKPGNVYKNASEKEVFETLKPQASFSSFILNLYLVMPVI